MSTMIWQSIETAPKNRTVILGCCISRTEENRGVPMYYFPKAVFFGEYHPNAPGKKLWRDADSRHKTLLTHWMPLPAPPKGVRSFMVGDSVKFTHGAGLYVPGIVVTVNRTTLIIRAAGTKHRVHQTNVKPLHESSTE